MVKFKIIPTSLYVAGIFSIIGIVLWISTSFLPNSMLLPLFFCGLGGVIYGVLLTTKIVNYLSKMIFEDMHTIKIVSPIFANKETSIPTNELRLKIKGNLFRMYRGKKLIVEFLRRDLKNPNDWEWLINYWGDENTGR